ncbi:MAG: hypothetical protein ACRCSB_03375, partial [Bacteroidales bacterium]
ANVNGGLGTYWCQGGASFDGKGRPVLSNNTTVSGGEASCNTYGAMYGVTTMLSNNGMAPTQAAPTGNNAYSIVEGICPKGWIFPGRKDWAVMFNKVAKCSDALAETVVTTLDQNAPCYHLTNTSAGSITLNPTVASIVPTALRSTLSSRATKPDSSFMTATNPVWPWYGVGTKRSHGSRPIDYYGFSALPSTLVWSNNFDYTSWARFSNASSTGTSSNIERIHGFYNSSVISIRSADWSTQSGAFLRCVREHGLDT